MRFISPVRYFISDFLVSNFNLSFNSINCLSWYFLRLFSRLMFIKPFNFVCSTIFSLLYIDEFTCSTLSAAFPLVPLSRSFVIRTCCNKALSSPPIDLIALSIAKLTSAPTSYVTFAILPNLSLQDGLFISAIILFSWSVFFKRLTLVFFANLLFFY